MDISEAMKLARGGRALLFLGAGFSCDTPNAGSGHMKSGQGFSDLLATKVSLPVGTGLMDTSEAYLEQFGATSLVKELISEFSAIALLPQHLEMASVQWKQIYTTNYDDIVEKSYKNKKLELVTINPDDPISKIPHGKSACIHLNGSIITISETKLASQIRLTDSSYLTSALSDSDWAVRLRQDIDSAQAVFYVGYSTYDIDIARLLFAKPALKEKSFFVVGASTNPVLKRRIEKFGIDTGLSAETFFAEVTKDDYIPITPLPLPEKCIRTYEPSATTPVFSDRDVFDLFMVGKLSESLVFESVTDRVQYVCHRKALDRALELVERTPAAIAVHSSLGNGKSLFLEMVKVSAAINGFTVVQLVRQHESLYEELDVALKRGGKLLILIDNYGDWQDAIRFIGNHHNKNLSVLLAARAGTNDVLASRMQENLKLGDLSEVSLDRLHDEDLLKIAQLMDSYGLWGDKASWLLSQKLRHLSEHCNREWQAILVELFKAPQIRDRLNILIDGIKTDKTYNLIFIAILVLAIIDHPATTDMLTDLCGERTLTVGFRQNETINELIDFDRDDVRLKSAVTGAFILKQVADAEVILDSLIKIVRSADQASSVSREYLVILGALLRFGNAQNFFPDDKRNEMVIRYYEAMKELPHCKRFPLFWLQYAIACLFVQDYDRAGTYFASAYSFARQSNFRTFQIDNHYARYLLLRSIHDDSSALAVENFRKGRALIFEQMRRERLHYPFRVATLIGDWYDSFGDRITEDERQEVKRTAGFIAARIAELPADRQRHKDISVCYSRMRSIIEAV